MKRQLHIFLWGLAAYILSYFIFFAVVNESREPWAYWAYHGWVYAKFALPTLVLITSTLAAIRTRASQLPKRMMWISWGAVSTLVIAYISYDAWRLYLVQDDAPMGIIPDLNIVLCTIIAGFLLLGFNTGRWIIQRFSKNNKEGQQDGEFDS